MSPATYLIVIPLSVIAVSGWLVKRESDVFSQGVRTSQLQQVARHGNGRVSVARPDVPGTAKLDHQRYAWLTGETGLPLGMDVQSRPLGARAAPATDWLEKATARVSSQDGVPEELRAIPDYRNMPEPGMPRFESAETEGGFNITADEATRVDLSKGTVVFNGHVRLTSPQFHLKSAKLVVHLSKDKKTFRMMEAMGDVDIQLTGVPEEKRYRGQSGVAVYEPGKGTLTMTQWPKVQGSGQEQVAAEAGTQMVLFPQTGQMVTKGKAQTRVAKRLMEEEKGKGVSEKG